MKVYIVSGCVGTGKTTFAKKLTKEKKAEYLNVKDLIKKYDISSEYDKKRKCDVVDISKLIKVLNKIIKESKRRLVIDSHLSHYLNPKNVDKCYITKCDIKELRKRLKKRNYSKSKIEENTEAEIMDVCYNEALEKGHKIEIVWSSKK